MNCFVTNQPSVSDWVVQVPLWPSGLGIGLWNRRPGFDPRTVHYIGGSGNPGSPVSGSSPPWLKMAWARGLGFIKGGSNVMNQPSVSDWVVQVPLWPSGLGIGLWNRRPGFDPRTIHYTGGSGNPGSPLSGSSPPWLKMAWARGLRFIKGGSNVMNQPSVSDWVVQVPLWPSGLGIGLWNRRPGFDPHTVRYSLLLADE